MMSKRRINKCISLTLSIIMMLSLMSTMNLTAFGAGTQDLVVNGNMENGTNYWHSNGGSQLVSVTDEKHSGSSSVKTNGRTNPWNGVAQVLTDNPNVPEAGSTYHASAWVMFKGEPDTKVTFKITVKRHDGTSDKYDTAAELNVTAGQWTLLEGDYTLPEGTDISKGVQIYVETSESGSFTDFYADDVSFLPAGSSSNDKLVALTFDDGPDNTLTALVLDKLDKYDVPATFFMIGSKINDSTAATVKRVAASGHEIGNHSWSYADMKTMTAEQVKKSVADTTYAIEQYSGTTPVFFRPPNLSVSDTMFDVIDMPFASGITANDWTQTTTAEQRANAIISSAKDGSIILLHDVQPLPHPTPEALDIIIPDLLSKGYKFVTLSELFKKKGVAINPNDKTMYVTVGVDAPVIEGKDIVNNGDFENGKEFWNARGDASIEAATDIKHGGNSSLKVTGRKNGWQGAVQNLVGNGKGDPVAGKTYTGTAWVMYNGASDSETMTFKLSVQWNNGAEENGDKYDTVSEVTVTKGEWTKLEGSYTIPSGAIFDKGIQLYVETAETDNLPSYIDFYVDDVSFKSQESSEPAGYDYDPTLTSLRSVWDQYFPIGAAIRPDMIEDPTLSQYLKKHYASLTAENVMKPEEIQLTEGIFTFEKSDKIVDFAQKNNMLVRGHTFVWHSQTPDWFFTDPDDSSKPASREKLLERMKTHIDTFMTRYNGKFHTYDVVNEVISDGVGLRDSKWKQIIGDVDKDEVDDDYIIAAFKYAYDKATELGDNDVKLCINDYGIESSSRKLDALYDTVKRILDSGIPKDRLVVGFQMHISNYTPSMEQIKNSIEKIASLGVKVQITELDISIYKNDSESIKPVTEEILLTQAKRYKDLFDLLKEQAEKGVMDSVTLWGTDDGMTWLNDFPVPERTNAPLLFNKRLQAKPAYIALTDPDSLPVYKQQLNAYKASPVLGNDVDILWSSLKAVDVTQSVYGPESTTAKVKTMWDNDKLYILAQVADNTESTKDSLEIFLDKNTASGNDSTHLTIASDNTVTGEVYGSVTSEVYSITKRDENGYMIQVAVPISTLSPIKGDKFEIDFRVKDYNSDDVLSSVVVWNDYKNRIDTDTTGYGYLALQGELKLIQVKKGTPKIDGKVDSLWNGVEANNTDVWVAGSSGSTAKFKTLWSENTLYVLAEVTDSKLSKASSNAYEQDSIEIFIDQNNGKTSSYQADDYQIRVNFDNDVSYNPGPLEGFMSSAKTTEKGYIVEAAIPFTAIKAEAGDLLGFDLQVNNDEDDNGSRDSVSIWCDASGNSWQNLSGLGNILLTAEAAIPVETPSPSSTVTPTATTNPGNNNNPGSQSTATPTPIVTPTVTASASTTPTATAKPSATSIPNSPKPAAGDISSHWAKEYINDLISKGIISGYADGTIKPDQNISRAELAVVIIKALGLKPSADAKVDFTDAKSIPSWALSYIALAKEKGIIQGNADKTFLPNKECSRQEALTMIMRAFKLGESTKELKFKDVKDIQKWSYNFIAKATEMELIKGYPDNTFKPGNSITRAELFTVLYKCIKK